MKSVGVLALQGAVAEHLDCLNKLPNTLGRAVRTIEEIEATDGLILPGGESTALGKLLAYFSLLEPLRKKILNGFPVWGTCAGLILLAKKIDGQAAPYFQAMDIDVKRNAYGSQLSSFHTAYEIPDVAAHPLPMTFIRAPYIQAAEPNVKILAHLDGKIVAARQDHLFVTAFHPELTDDLSIHQYFIDKIIPRK